MNPSRLFDILEYAKNNHPLKNALNTKYNGKWENISTLEYAKKVNIISSALISIGVMPGDKIAMVSSTNRSEWSIVDMGISQIGAINVPLYPTITSNDYKYILNHSECKYCFVSDTEVFEKINPIKKNVKSLKNIYSFDDMNNCDNWKILYDLGNENEYKKLIVERKNNIKSYDLATIIYTSGKENGYSDNLRNWFKLIYEVFFGEENGPRMGFFISFFGLKETIDLMEKKLKI